MRRAQALDPERREKLKGRKVPYFLERAVLP
jgi:hypothetical protein